MPPRAQVGAVALRAATRLCVDMEGRSRVTDTSAAEVRASALLSVAVGWDPAFSVFGPPWPVLHFLPVLAY